MTRDSSLDNIDEALVRRLLGLSRGSQRWLKTALQTVRTMPPAHEVDEPHEAPPVAPPPAQQLRPASSDLEEVISGRADLKDQMEAYPELAGELEGLGDIIDMLRDLGEQRRKRGTDILREEILGQPPESGDDEEDDFRNGSPAF